jgi:hypothetical protein
MTVSPTEQPPIASQAVCRKNGATDAATLLQRNICGIDDRISVDFGDIVADNFKWHKKPLPA